MSGSKTTVSINIPPKFRSENSDKYCLQGKKNVLPLNKICNDIHKETTYQGHRKTVPKQQHTRSYQLHLGKIWLDWDARKKKSALTRPCYESAPSACRSGTNSSINDTYCFPATTKTLQRIQEMQAGGTWPRWISAQVCCLFSSKWLERERKLRSGKSRQNSRKRLLEFLQWRIVGVLFNAQVSVIYAI